MLADSGIGAGERGSGALRGWDQYVQGVLTELDADPARLALAAGEPRFANNLRDLLRSSEVLLRRFPLLL